MDIKHISIEFNSSLKEPLYIQLYNHIKGLITDGSIGADDKLPSLRNLADDLGISVTTADLAYNQLSVEGYIYSKPKSGYYASSLSGQMLHGEDRGEYDYGDEFFAPEKSPYFTDSNSFDFAKWKKTMQRVFELYSDSLLFESDPQGEKALRVEIARYIYKFRGVIASPDRIFIGAGTQQLTTHLCRIMKLLKIGHVASEEPGYIPVQNIFRDNGFIITGIPVLQDGIDISKLPTNISSAVYVSPSNQFPTGALMPVGKRYDLLHWASDNNSFIIEDDYDSELRYFGKPIPALQGLDKDSRVVYLGSFSSTLFPAIKISYMVLPTPMADVFNNIKGLYTQTCSKAEQLTLALFMKEGSYESAIRRTRKLYSQKLSEALSAFEDFGRGLVVPLNTKSGINIILKTRFQKSPRELANLAKSLKLQVSPVESITPLHNDTLIFYYNQIPIEKIRPSIKALFELWNK